MDDTASTSRDLCTPSSSNNRPVPGEDWPCDSAMTLVGESKRVCVLCERVMSGAHGIPEYLTLRICVCVCVCVCARACGIVDLCALIELKQHP